MLGQIIIQPRGPRIHQRLQPHRTLGVQLLQQLRRDEHLHPQVQIDFSLALGFRRPAKRSQVVGLDAIEVVLALRIDHAEHHVGIGFTVDVGDAPVVSNDVDALGLFGPTGEFGGRLRL